MQADKITRLRQTVLGRLESLQLAGVLQIPKERLTIRIAGERSLANSNVTVAEATSPSAEVASAQSEAPMKKKPSRGVSRAISLFEAVESSAKVVPADVSLDVIQQEVAACTLCAELASTRTQTVFGVGNPSARICFLGEAPGADEDRMGEPFVGRGGQLLNKIIEACRIKREDVYILNMIKCRPPGNRNPLPTELDNCRSYLERQLDLIRPELICCLGAVASQNLLG